MPTTNNSNKRVRLETSTNTDRQPNKNKNMSPTKAASDALLASIESLPDNLHPLLLHFGTKIIECRSKLSNKSKMKEKLQQDTEYVPKSARATEFQITLSKAAAEDSDTVAALEAAAQEAKNQYETSLTKIVLGCIELELKALASMETAITLDALKAFSEATATEIGIECDPHLRATNLIEKDDSFLRFNTTNTKTAIRLAYANHHGITIPDTTWYTIADTFETDEQRQMAVDYAVSAQNKPENRGLQTFGKAMEIIFITPWRAFKRQQNDNNRAIALKKLATEIIDGKATEDAAMELDAEGGANFEQLQDLIRKEVDKKDKKYNNLAQKCNQLEKLVADLKKHSPTSTKNKKNYKKNNNNDNNKTPSETPKKGTPRGQPGASGKKKFTGNNQNKNKTTRRKSPSGRRPKQQNDTDDDKSNASAGNNRNGHGRRSNGSSKPTLRASSKGRQTQRRT